MNAITSFDSPAGTQQHCTRVAAGAQWTDPTTQTKEHRAVGETMSTQFHVCKQGDTVSFDADMLGEEVGAILEGQFDILAANEAYCLSTGEAILIPPGEARRFQCVSPRGVLYRVTVLPTGERSEITHTASLSSPKASNVS